MFQEFCERINLKTDLSKLAEIICKKYNLGEYISEEIILVGYEDFNFILTTNKGKYCVKVFNKDRTFEDVNMYIDRIKLANKLKVNTPKVYECNRDILCEIEQHLNENDYKKLDELYNRFLQVDIEKLPKAFVHGDIINTNVMKDKNNKLTDYELEQFPLFFDIANAMGILQISHLNTLGELSEEDKFWYDESKKGLEFSDTEFWNDICVKK